MAGLPPKTVNRAHIAWGGEFLLSSSLSPPVQLNKCVVCGSVLQRGNGCVGCLSSSIVFRYECRVGHLFVLSWVRRVALESFVSV